jgi:hypothetical protein
MKTTKSINSILNLMERISEKECEFDISLDGTITFTISNKEINPVHIPEDFLDYSTEEPKLVLDDDTDFDEFITSLPTRIR